MNSGSFDASDVKRVSFQPTYWGLGNMRRRNKQERVCEFGSDRKNKCVKADEKGLHLKEEGKFVSSTVTNGLEERDVSAKEMH